MILDAGDASRTLQGQPSCCWAYKGGRADLPHAEWQTGGRCQNSQGRLALLEAVIPSGLISQALA